MFFNCFLIKTRQHWIIVKPEREESARELFQSTAINVTTEGHRHLGAVIGSQDYQKDYVDGKVTEWVSEIVKLAYNSFFYIFIDDICKHFYPI